MCSKSEVFMYSTPAPEFYNKLVIFRKYMRHDSRFLQFTSNIQIGCHTHPPDIEGGGGVN